jgi:protoheme IX farnesyltransferase
MPNGPFPALTWRDYVTLTKPRITLLCLIMTLGGMGLAPQGVNWSLILWTLVGTFLSVGSANALNMWWEREGDKLMERTRSRPLASGRMRAWQALSFGLGLGVASIVVLAMGVNVLTAILGTFALASYVLVYTPLKRRTPLALVIGAVPGAMPPLMGWTAVTGHIDTAGLVLFGILLVWQIPHFIAISICHQEDYSKAGIATVPGKHGDAIAKLQSLAYSLLLIPISLMFVPLGVAGVVYFALALALGVWFTWHAAKGFRPESGKPWARKFFFASLVYLPALTVALMVDITLGRYF